MQNTWKRAISAALAISLLGSAVMLSVGQAKGPYRHVGENSFDRRSLGHPEKALIANWQSDVQHTDEAAPQNASFDWGFGITEACPKCGFKDSHVTPVVMDMPELLGPGDTAAIEVIKRKLGINAFRGSIFDGADEPATELMKRSVAEKWLATPRAPARLADEATNDAPPELRTFDVVLERLNRGELSTTAAAAAEDVSQDDVCPTNTSARESCESMPSLTVVSWLAATKQGACNDRCTCSSAPADATRTSLELTPVAVAAENPTAALRRAGTELDEVASRLEENDRYTEADALREAAQLLRVKARGLKNGESATAHMQSPKWTSESAPSAADYRYGTTKYKD